MAKYDVSYSCGHEGTVTLFGPTAERDRKIEWMASQGRCPECYKAHISEQREQSSKEAAEKAKILGLPQLTGSEKQIAWAESIRMSSIEKFTRDVVGPDGTLSDMLQKLQSLQDAGTDTEKRGAEFALNLVREPNAKWWIDHRRDYTPGLLAIHRPNLEFPDLGLMVRSHLNLIELSHEKQKAEPEAQLPATN